MIVIVDGNGLIWRAVYSLGEQQVAYGVLDYLNQIIEKFSPESLLICWDSGKSRYRSEIYPEYKAHRKERKDKLDMETISSQSDCVRSYLGYKGIQQLRVYGIEADDLISWTSEYISTYLNKQVMVLSADKDLWQLVNDNISVYDLMRGTKATPEVVQKVFGVPPSFIPQWKALVGDSSDNIKGVKGLGEKRVQMLFKKYNSVEQMLQPEAVKQLSKSAVTAKLYTHEDDYERDLLLTRIPKLKDLFYFTSQYELQNLKVEVFKISVIDENKAAQLADTFGKALIVYRALIPIDFTNMPLDHSNKIQYKTWFELDTAITTCNKCVLRSHCGQKGPTLASGYSDARIMLVGRNPCATEREAGEPFTGASGELVDEFLVTCGLTRRDVYMTNVCKCYSENNRAITLGEIDVCKDYLQAEVDLLKPKLIITFGNEAMSLFTHHKAGVSRYSGELMMMHENSL